VPKEEEERGENVVVLSVSTTIRRVVLQTIATRDQTRKEDSANGESGVEWQRDRAAE